ncbi:hypothetical protein KAJ89_03745 [Candidatus Parcubacteria bacterium]|nr:hypothetical protein [Candidatus Parcubacteria bacterium]
MKTFFSVIVSLVCLLFVMGCGSNSMSIDEAETLVQIAREGHLTNESIKINCNSAILDYVKRQVIITGPKHLGSSNNEFGWVVTVDIVNNKLVLGMPVDSDYTVWIAGQKHLLTKQ